MKTISIKQPFASLIVEGIKDVVNRNWECPKKYIGQRVLIHASLSKYNLVTVLNKEQKEVVKLSGNWSMCAFPDTGVIIGSVKIVDCVINHRSIWAQKTTVLNRLFCNRNGVITFSGPSIYNWVLAEPIKFPEPIPAKGKLRFWDFNAKGKLRFWDFNSTEHMECTNNNTRKHQSCGEKIDCIQNCPECDYYRFIYDKDI